MITKSILMPLTLARKIALIARQRHITFNDAIYFLLQKVEAPCAEGNGKIATQRK